MSDAIASPEGVPDDIRPVVRTGGSSNLMLWIFGAILLLIGLLLFQTLNARRQQTDTPATASGDGSVIAAPPALPLPYPYPDPALVIRSPIAQATRLPSPVAAPQPPANVTRVVERPIGVPTPDSRTSQLPPQPAYVPPMATTMHISPTPQPAAAARDDERVTATRLANPSLTVAKGTIVAAVLETALDSTRPGAVRAVVSRDVKSFDGSRVLIPRGSRLYGEYTSDLASGQNRALIRWERLTRPDAVIVNLDSPAADPLGRAGVGGKVDSHFLARFGSAILQSVLDIGVGVATRSISDDPLILTVPRGTQQIGGQQPAQIQPTLRVNQGTSVSVFVARDLDFSTVDR